MIEEIEATLLSLAEQGITTSICFGPCGNLGILYSVNVLTSLGESFRKPYATTSLLEAARIAKKECIERGWMV